MSPRHKKSNDAAQEEGQDTSRGTVGQPEREETPQDAQEDHQEAPTGPRLTSRISKDDRLSACLCSCGKLVKNRFAAGHDMRLVTYAKEYVRKERELTEEQMAYLRESGKRERAKAQVEKEDARNREKVQRRAEHAAKAEAKRKK